jgi:hypothetical protein
MSAFLLESDRVWAQSQDYPVPRSTGRCAASLVAAPSSVCFASLGCSVCRPRHAVGRLRAGACCRMRRCARFAAASGMSYQDSQLSRDSRFHSGTGVLLGRGCDAVTSADGLRRGSCGPSTRAFNHGSASRSPLSSKIHKNKKRPKRALFLLTMLRRCCRVWAAVNESGTGDDGPVRGLSPQRARKSR